MHSFFDKKRLESWIQQLQNILLIKEAMHIHIANESKTEDYPSRTTPTFHDVTNSNFVFVFSALLSVVP